MARGRLSVLALVAGLLAPFRGWRRSPRSKLGVKPQCFGWPRERCWWRLERNSLRRFAALGASALTLGTLLALAAGATSLVRMSLPELARAAEAIVRARCLGSEARWEGGEIWTFTRFEPLETLAGTAPQPLVVRLIGGRVGNLASHVDGVPRFRAGEEVILFLESTRAGDFSVTAWSEGSFRIHRDARTGGAWVTEDSAATGVFDPATHRFEPAGIRRMPLELFEERLHAILRSSAGAPRQ